MAGHVFENGFLEEYKAHLLEEERGASTVEKYLHDAEEFVRWLEGDLVSKQAMIAWKSVLPAKSLPPATVNEKLCRKLKKYAEKQKIISSGIFFAKDGVSWSRKQVWREMKRLCEAAEVAPSKACPHNPRHLLGFLPGLPGHRKAGGIDILVQSCQIH